MKRPRVILSVCALVIIGLFAVGAWRAKVWYDGYAARKLERFESELNDNDPQVRQNAARGILNHDPDRQDVKLILTKSLMERGRFGQARDLLRVMMTARTTLVEQRSEILTMHADCYLTEAENTVASSAAESADLIAPEVTKLLNEVDAVRDLLEAHPNGKVVASIISARKLDVRSSLLRLELKHITKGFADAQLAGSDHTMRLTGVRMSALQSEIDQIDRRLVRLCKAAIDIDETRSDPFRILFLVHLRRGEVEEARSVASRVADKQQVDRALAGDIADRLIFMEYYYHLETTGREIAIARRLVMHENPVGPDTLRRHDIARIGLALYEGRSAEAETLGRKIVDALGSTPRVAALVGEAMVDQGKPDKAVELLFPFEERVRSHLIRNALAKAYLQQKRPDRALEMLRLSLELNDQDIEARLLLVQTLAGQGHIVEAEPDIARLAEIAPFHSGVLGFQARLEVERDGIDGKVKLLNKRVGEKRVEASWRDLALVAAMVLDDHERVRRLSDEILQRRHGDVLALVAKAWQETEAERRTMMAGIVVRVILEQFDADPLLHPHSPKVPALGEMLKYTSNANGVAVVAPRDPDRVMESQFVPWAEQLALQLVEAGLERWPDQQRLVLLAAELNLWLDQGDEVRKWLKRYRPESDSNSGQAMVAFLDGEFEKAEKVLSSLLEENSDSSPTCRLLALAVALGRKDSTAAHEAMRQMLRHHPWAELATLWAIRDALRNNDSDRADAWIDLIQSFNPKMMLLARGRRHLWHGRYNEALHDVELVVRGESTSSDVRFRAAEIRAQANLYSSRIELALGSFESMAIAAKHAKVEMKIGTADALLFAGRQRGAIVTISKLLTEGEASPRWRDRLLARALVVMENERARTVIDSMLTYQPKDELLLLYKARVLVAAGDVPGAEMLVKRVLISRPDAPRALMAMADLAGRLGRNDEAAAIYRKLIKRGGHSASAAEGELEKLKKDT